MHRNMILLATLMFLLNFVTGAEQPWTKTTVKADTVMAGGAPAPQP